MNCEGAKSGSVRALEKRSESTTSRESTHRRKVQRVADPKADPVGPRDDGREEELRDVELEEEREERVGVDVERVRPVGYAMASA